MCLVQAAIAASRLNNPGHVLITQRMGQSLTVSMRAPGGAADGSTAAERAERAVLATRRPLSGLLKAQVWSRKSIIFQGVLGVW